MAKRRFVMPTIILNSGWSGGDGGETGDGSGGLPGPDDIDYTKCGYEEWLEWFPADNNLDDVIDFEDYRTWWIENELSEEDWNLLNPGTPLNPPNP